MEKRTFVGLCVAFWSIFLRKKLLPDYPCKSHDHDHKWTDLDDYHKDKRKCEHNIRLVFVYILLSTCQ